MLHQKIMVERVAVNVQSEGYGIHVEHLVIHDFHYLVTCSTVTVISTD